MYIRELIWITTNLRMSSNLDPRALKFGANGRLPYGKGGFVFMPVISPNMRRLVASSSHSSLFMKDTKPYWSIRAIRGLRFPAPPSRSMHHKLVQIQFELISNLRALTLGCVSRLATSAMPANVRT
jgi:hypothetical protein